MKKNPQISVHKKVLLKCIIAVDWHGGCFTAVTKCIKACMVCSMFKASMEDLVANSVCIFHMY